MRWRTGLGREIDCDGDDGDDDDDGVDVVEEDEEEEDEVEEEEEEEGAVTGPSSSRSLGSTARTGVAATMPYAAAGTGAAMA